MNIINSEENLDLITVSEAAALLRIKPQTVRLYLMNGRLPRKKLCSQWHGKPLFFKEKLIDFVRNPDKYQEGLCL